MTNTVLLPMNHWKLAVMHLEYRNSLGDCISLICCRGKSLAKGCCFPFFFFFHQGMWTYYAVIQSILKWMLNFCLSGRLLFILKGSFFGVRHQKAH